MPREAPRTLYTLKNTYQGISPDLYEVIVVENGSSRILGADAVAAIDPDFRYLPFPATTPSPAAAINAGVRASRGNAVGILIDGARMLSPGVIKYSLLALSTYSRPLISTIGCHLGYKPQQQSVLEGYNQSEEDILLQGIDWQSNGYELFRISSLAGSSKYGIWSPLAESNAVVMQRQMFEELGGFDENFVSPGGGLVNLDFYQRAQNLPDVQLITLLGEASFHQLHGGVTTQAEDKSLAMASEYQLIRGKPFKPYLFPLLSSDYLGKMPEQFISWLKISVTQREDFLLTYPEKQVYKDNNFYPSQGTLKNRVIAILGMHRSGTSLLTGTLQEAGLVLGDVVTEAPHNLKGNRESLPIRSLHDDLLKRSGGAWDNPPDSVVWDPIHNALRDSIIEKFSLEKCWGFKDPRSLFCLDGWLAALPNLEFVGIIRHPEEVARSLNTRNQFTIDEGINLWFKYNQRLFSLYENIKFPLIHFSENSSNFCLQASELIQLLDLPRKPSASELKFYDSTLCHHVANNFNLPLEVEDLYQKLLGSCLKSNKILDSGTGNYSFAKPPEKSSDDSKGWRFQSWSWWRNIKKR